jgi:outer membrane receptor protein involved in Fe transport
VRHELFWLSTVALAGFTSQAYAQTQAAPAPETAQGDQAQGTATVEGVVVTGAGQGIETSIDRRSYSVTADLQAAAGSIGDALRNLPSVAVDVQGEISLRGDRNVTIMIDGKPSGMFRGDNRASALQQLPADQFERVEVITNPSAAFDPDGSAGIINLISKKGRGAGSSGSVRANYGDRGRYNASISGTHNANKLTLNGDASLRRNVLKMDLVDRRTSLDLATGHPIETLNTSGGALRSENRVVHGSIDYDLDDKTRLSLDLRRVESAFSALVQERLGPLSRPTTRIGDMDASFSTLEAFTTFRRKFDGEGHDLTITARQDANVSSGERPFIYLANPPPGGVYEVAIEHNDRTRRELKAEYKRPMHADAKLTLGYQLQADDNAYDNLGARGASPETATIEPGLTARFFFEQSVNSLYGTYERGFGDLSMVAGLRLEDVRIKTYEVVIGRRDRSDYVQAYPSLHLGYQLSDERRVTLSYSRRVQRPNPFQLNPFGFYQDPYSLFRGNPRLKPQITDAIEAGYQYRNGQSLYSATAYYRNNRHAVTQVVADLGGGSLVTTLENLGSMRTGGIEFTTNGRLNKQLSFNLSGNTYWMEIDPGRLGYAARSVTTVSGQGSLDWQATPKDFLQLNLSLTGKRLAPQGEWGPSAVLNLGYRHKFNDRLSGLVTAQDVLDSFRNPLTIETPVLRQRVDRKINAQAVFVGFSYAFGGGDRRPKDPGFEYGS